MKHLLLIATGGTIASRHTAEGLAPQLTPAELLSYVPDAASFCSIDTVQPINLDSTNIRPEHWLLLANLIEEHYSRYDGFVICHGHLGLHGLRPVLFDTAHGQAHCAHRGPALH